MIAGLHQVASRMAAGSRLARSDRAPEPGRLPRGDRVEPVGHRARILRHDDPQRDPPEDARVGAAGRRHHRRGVLLPARCGRQLRLPQAETGHVRRDRAALQHQPERRADRRRLAARFAGRLRQRLRAVSGPDRQGRKNPGHRRPAAGDHGVRRPGRDGQPPAENDRAARAARRQLIIEFLETALRQSFLFLRSLLFTVVMIVSTIVWACVCFLAAPLPYNKRFYVTARWNVFMIWCLKVICGIRYEVRGAENFPDAPAVVLSKHQSAWETIFLLPNMPRPLVFVFKKEILYIPFFGWAMALLRMIPIDRKQGMYKSGGTRLAVATGAVVVPIAHNSGECWPKNSFIKRPGLITVSIGKPISPEGQTADAMMLQVENWIESEMRVISPHAYSAG